MKPILLSISLLAARADPSARKALLRLMTGDPQPEIRAACVAALDALDPDAAPGSVALREWLLPIADAGIRHWWKPEEFWPWRRNRHVLRHLATAQAEEVFLPLLAGKDDGHAETACRMLKLIAWRKSDALLALWAEGLTGEPEGAGEGRA